MKKKYIWGIVSAILLVLMAVFVAIGCFWTSFKIKPIVLDAKEDDETAGKVCFGSLQIDVPVGWRYETRTSEEGQTQLVLIDAHSESEDADTVGHPSLYEHEIVIVPYEVVRLPQDQLEVLVGLLEYFEYGKIQNFMENDTDPIQNYWLGSIYDSETWMNYYFLLSYSEEIERRELFVVSEHTSYAWTNMIEDFYYGYTVSDCVALYNGMITIDCPTKRGEYFFLFEQKDSVPLLVKARKEDDVTRVEVYDYYETEKPLSELCLERKHFYYPEDWHVDDLNQDGYDDFWDDFYDEDWEDAYEGYLWNPQTQIFEFVNQSTFGEKYKDKITEPKLLITEQDKVPEGLIETISQGIIQGQQAIYDMMEPMVNDREMDEAELLVLAKEQPAIKNLVQSMASSATYEGTWVMVDADNDGIEDVFLRAYYSGTMGLVYYHLFAGEEDGSYTDNFIEENIIEEFAFLNWDGKNYLAQTTYDYNRKMYDGIRLTSFKDGRRADVVWLQMVIADNKDAHHTEVVYLAEEKYYDTLGETIFDFEGNYDIYAHPQGNAEQEVGEDDSKLECDIDNDGVTEQYLKTVWEPSNYYTQAHLLLNFEEESEEALLYKTIWEEGFPMFMWVDETQWGNIIYVLYEDSRYDFHICAYLLTEEKCEMLMKVNHTFDLEVNLIIDVEPGTWGLG